MNPREIEPLDTTIRIVTPENIAFSYRVAGPFHRLGAYVIDMVAMSGLLVVLWFVVLFTMARLGIAGVGVGILLAISWLILWFLFGFLEVVWNGQTLGKRWLRLRVVSKDGRPITASQAILRNFLRAVDFLPIFHQVGFFTAVSNDRFQRVGDLACGTMVIIEEQPFRLGQIQFNDPIVSRFADQIPAGYRPSRSLTRAIARYVERRHYLTPPRRMEIAAHVAVPLLERFGMPSQTNPDLLLCAIYHREFAEASRAGG